MRSLGAAGASHSVTGEAPWTGIFLSLKTSSWTVAPLAIERAHSSYFTDQEMFPAGSIDFDCALVMRNIAHEWETTADLIL